MNILKRMVLALILIIFSVAGLRAEEVSPNYIDEASLIQKALQLRETKPELFSGAQGLLVFVIAPNSQAEKKGLQRGDIVIAYAEQPLNTTEQFVRTIHDNATKSQIELRFIRANTVHTVMLQGGEIGIHFSEITVEFAVQLFLNVFFEALQDERKKTLIWKLILIRPQTAEKAQQWLFRNGAENLGELLATFRDVHLLLAIFQQEGEQAQVANHYLFALETFQKGLKKARQFYHQPYIGQYLNNIGTIYQQLAQYQQALEHFQQALIIYRELKDPYGEGVTLSNIGVTYSSLGKYQQALEHFKKSLDINQLLHNLEGQATNLTNIGNVHNILHNFPKARDFYQKATTLQEKINDPRGKSINLNNIGVLYDKMGDYVKALEYYQKGLDLDRKINNLRGEATELNNIGVVHEKRNEYQKALKYLKQALKIRRDLLDRHGESTSLTNIGSVHKSLGDYQKALDFYEQALAIAREISDPHIKITNINNIGVIYLYLGKYQQALKKLEQALSMSRKIKNPLDEGTSLTNIGAVYLTIGNYPQALQYFQDALSIHRDIGNSEGEGGTLNNIGYAYLTFGNYIKALEYFKKALVIHRSIYARHGESTDLNNIGSVYQNLGQYDKALDFFNKALEVDQSIHNHRGEAIDRSNIGVVYGKREEYEKALKYFQQALAGNRKIDNQTGIGINKLNIGVIHNERGQYEEALKNFRQARTILHDIGNVLWEGYTLVNLGDVHMHMGQYREALSFFQDGLNILNKIQALNHIWYAQNGLALVKVHFNQFDAAIFHYEQALDNIEALRAELKEKSHKLSFMHDKFVVYDNFITLLQTLHSKYPEKGYDRKAIEIFERKQGRVFLEEMGKSGAQHFAGVPKEISQQDRILEHQIATTRKQHIEILVQGKDAEQHYKRLEKLQAEQADFEKTLQTDYPAYYALKYPKPVALKTLQNDVLQENELLLVYNVRKEATDLWIIGKKKDQFQMLKLNIGEKELQTKIDAFRKSPNDIIQAINEERFWEISDLAEDNLPSLRQTSYDLYRLLMPEKAKTLLKDARTLYIVPTGPLYALPFGALDTHNPAQHDTPYYLIQDYPIAYLSSTSLLKIIRDTERKESNRYPFLAFADPEYPKKNCLSKSDNAKQVIQAACTKTLKIAGSENDACFKQLPETKTQAQAIAKLLKSPKGSNALQLRVKASRSNVFKFNDNKRLDDYQYVLFAAHGILPNEINHIKQSAIVLSNPDTEGYLTMADAFALEMNADLVMLSACNTGCGEKIRGEGVRGLTRAFMYAGTPAVSVSLWSVGSSPNPKVSSSTKTLSISLFKYLQTGKPLAQALRQSKLDLMADEDMEMYQHPYFWAPFVVFGDGNYDN
jgi:tetratricopeptide (TPR) repeat protein/CHAT domain-containing protein